MGHVSFDADLWRSPKLYVLNQNISTLSFFSVQCPPLRCHPLGRPEILGHNTRGRAGENLHLDTNIEHVTQRAP